MSENVRIDYRLTYKLLYTINVLCIYKKVKTLKALVIRKQALLEKKL